MTFEDFVPLVARIAMVDPHGLAVDTRLSAFEFDSLQMFELLVHVEDITGVVCDESDLPNGDPTVHELYILFDQLVRSARRV